MRSSCPERAEPDDLWLERISRTIHVHQQHSVVESHEPDWQLMVLLTYGTVGRRQIAGNLYVAGI